MLLLRVDRDIKVGKCRNISWTGEEVSQPTKGEASTGANIKWTGEEVSQPTKERHQTVS